MDHIRALNSLRGLAAMVVVIAHYERSINAFGGFSGRGSGQIGVMIFFVLSGFLMSYLYLQENFNKTQLYKYFVARLARVAPLFIIVVVVSYFFQITNIKGVFYNISSLEEVASHVLLLSGKSVLWTIPPEIHFYILFVFLWCVYSKSPKLMLVIIAAAFVFLNYLDYPVYKWRTELGLLIDFRLPKLLSYFLLGVLIGAIYNSWHTSEKIKSNYYAVILVIIPLLYPKVFTAVFGFTHEMWKDLIVLFGLGMWFVSILFLIPARNFILSNKLGDFLGKISYSLYLLHLPTRKLLQEHAVNAPVFFFVIYILSSIMIAYLSYLIIENPLRKAIRKKLKIN
ncbi:MAG: acyltransferase [Ignavibacteriae bacterium]|nr:acyltransferase [Ignavibacteriota bacterium]